MELAQEFLFLKTNIRQDISIIRQQSVLYEWSVGPAQTTTICIFLPDVLTWPGEVGLKYGLINSSKNIGLQGLGIYTKIF